MYNDFIDNDLSLSDEELVAFIKAGQFEHFPALIRRFMPYIISRASDMAYLVPDTEDIIGEGVIAVFSAVKSFDCSKASFKTFARICIDRAINVKVRAASAEKRIPSDRLTPLEGLELADNKDPEAILIEREEYRTLSEALRTDLSDLEFKVLSRFLAGESYAGIAKDLGITVKSVDNALRRIRGKLKK